MMWKERLLIPMKKKKFGEGHQLTTYYSTSLLNIYWQKLVFQSFVGKIFVKLNEKMFQGLIA
jgi:hypothetical protein